MFNIKQHLYRVWAWGRFYLKAGTIYRAHSPFVFQWANEVVEDDRNYYAFGAIEALRQRLLANHSPIEVTDWGAGHGGERATAPAGAYLRKTTLAKVAASSASSALQGAMLFRLSQLHQPLQLLELGSSVGIGTSYIALGGPSKANFVTLEGRPVLAGVARLNLEALGAGHVRVVHGAFEHSLQQALEGFPYLDLVYFDGNHRSEPTLAYFAACLPKAHEKTVFVFDDMHWSADMEYAWEVIKSHEKVTLTIDCGHFACAFFSPEHKAKQHFSLVPSTWKPWQKYF